MRNVKNQKIILVSNIGSMSRKYFVYVVNKKTKDIQELFNIGFDKKDYHPELQDLSQALLKFFEIAKRDYNFFVQDIDVILERVVAVGEYFLEHKEIDQKYLFELEKVKKYNSLHTESLIHELQQIFLMQEVCQKNKIKAKFKLLGISDSAFHKTIAPEIYTYGLKSKKDETNNLSFRKFGYHGISASEVNRDLNNLNKNQKVIVVHLGGGGSVTAIKNNKSIYNSFGMTPVSGLMSMTRCGEIDPIIILEIFQKNKKSFSLLDDIDYQMLKTKKELYEESGMLALTGHKDMREILADLQLENNAKNKTSKDLAEFAIQVYLNLVVKEIAAAFAFLGGCDMLCLTGSILEKSEVIRKKLLVKLHWLNSGSNFEKGNLKKNIKIIKTTEEIEMVRIMLEEFRI